MDEQDETPVSMIMSTVDLIVARPDEPLRVLWDRMRRARIQHLPVLEGDVLIGIVSSWDIGRRVVEGGPDVLDASTAREVMERALERLHPRDPIAEATEILADASFHSLPVVDEQERLVGIVTSSDLLRYHAGSDEDDDDE
ncbi:MAG TPA: CBS domain-containing protein [Sandaracinaceae bacterium LLY-WYZ-13_1]|nr:CBS domain-containing protein [Sandaracinaceae bacterium LLY-WYZ-13_1]